MESSFLKRRFTLLPLVLQQVLSSVHLYLTIVPRALTTPRIWNISIRRLRVLRSNALLSTPRRPESWHLFIYHETESQLPSFPAP